MRSTGCPSLNRIRHGIPETWYCPARLGFSSVLSFTNLALPVFAAATFSTIGLSMRHGPHQGAQKSTSTGCGLFSTSESKLACVTSGNALINLQTLLKLGLLRLAGDLGDLLGLFAEVGDRDDLVAFAQPLEPYALSVATRLANVADLEANHLVTRGDHEDLVLRRNENL